MKSALTAAITFLLILVMAGLAQAISLGAPAADFTLSDTSGKAVSLSSFKGKTVILNFWSTTCPPCLAEMPSLENLHNQMGKKGVVVLGIAVEKDVSAVKEDRKSVV